eukprot:1817940-Pleurochrysis_carterae.AAC.1
MRELATTCAPPTAALAAGTSRSARVGPAHDAPDAWCSEELDLSHKPERRCTGSSTSHGPMSRSVTCARDTRREAASW